MRYHPTVSDYQRLLLHDFQEARSVWLAHPGNFGKLGGVVRRCDVCEKADQPCCLGARDASLPGRSSAPRVTLAALSPDDHRGLAELDVDIACQVQVADPALL